MKNLNLLSHLFIIGLLVINCQTRSYNMNHNPNKGLYSINQTSKNINTINIHHRNNTIPQNISSNLNNLNHNQNIKRFKQNINSNHINFPKNIPHYKINNIVKQCTFKAYKLLKENEKGLFIYMFNQQMKLVVNYGNIYSIFCLTNIFDSFIQLLKPNTNEYNIEKRIDDLKYKIYFEYNNLLKKQFFFVIQNWK